MNRTAIAILASLVCAVGALPQPGPASANPRAARVAVLTPGLAFAPVLEGLREGLAQRGYKEGVNLTLLVEDTSGGARDASARAAALVDARPDVLVSVATAHTAIAKRATSTIPIVFAWVGDPVQSGFVASYASSGNNLTGVSVYSAPLSAKRLEILQQVAPRIRSVLAVAAANDSIAEISLRVLQQAAMERHVEVIRRDVGSRDDIVRALQGLPKGSFDAIFHVPSLLVGAHIDLLIKRAKDDRVPLIVHEDTMVTAGALISYGADFRLVGLQAADPVTRILAGAKPSEIPVQIPDKLFVSVNLATARAIGLKIPRAVLERAERIFE
jgi:putative ABC transport system substrate-binding protein